MPLSGVGNLKLEQVQTWCHELAWKGRRAELLLTGQGRKKALEAGWTVAKCPGTKGFYSRSRKPSSAI